MSKDLIEQAEAVLKQHLLVGRPKASVGLIGKTPYKKFTSMRSFKETTSTLARVASYMGVARVKEITAEQAQTYLTERKEQHRASGILHGESDRGLTSLISQKTLDAERKALSILVGENIARVHTNSKTSNKSRAYTNEQAIEIAKHQTPRNAISTEIALEAGIRAKELLTIRRADELSITTNRKWHEARFSGVQGEKYVVIGKGGLVREIRINKELADKLESRRLIDPVVVTDRKVKYESYYDICGGNAFSKSFSDASRRALGFSNGAHGLRHQYAQSRMNSLRQQGYSEKEARLIVSQEVGHFRASITKVYLR